MSKQNALAFIRLLRENAVVRKEVQGVGGSLERLSAIATQNGLPCSASDIQAAYTHDWAMRFVQHKTYRRLKSS